MKSEHLLILGLVTIAVIGGIAFYQVNQNKPIDLSFGALRLKA